MINIVILDMWEFHEKWKLDEYNLAEYNRIIESNGSVMTVTGYDFTIPLSKFEIEYEIIINA